MYEDRESWLFLNLNPPLLSKFDLFIQKFNSNLQAVGVLIAKYHLPNDRIGMSDQQKNYSPLSLPSGALES